MEQDSEKLGAPEGSPDPAPSGHGSAPPTASRLGSWVTELGDDWQDMLVVASLLLLFWLVHRRVELVEFGGDAVAKWQFTRQWWHHFDWANGTLDHHSARMGVNVLAWLSQAMFGRGWRSYYIAPFFVAMLQLPFVYAIGKRIVNRLAGVLGVLFVTYLATVHRSASQLLPDPFAGTYAIITTYLIIRFADESEPARQRQRFLLGAAVMGFVGYLAKETFVFFFPGMVIAVWLARKSYRDVATFLGVMFGGFLLETAGYATFTKYSSRYPIVRSLHGADGWPAVKFGELLDRFAKFPDGWKYLCFFSLAAGAWLLALNQRERFAGRALALIGFSQVFVLTFGVRGFNPIEIWQRFEPRYIDPYTPFAAAMTGCLLGAAATSLWEEQAWPAWVLRFGPTRPVLAPFWLIAYIVLAASVHDAMAKPLKGQNGYALGAKLAKLCTDTYKRNLPIAQQRRVKLLNVIYDVYLDDQLLLKDGRLPNPTEVVRSERGYAYFVKSPERYPHGKFAQLLGAGCVLVATRTRAGNYELSSWEPLPSRCDELLQAPIRSEAPERPERPELARPPGDEEDSAE